MIVMYCRAHHGGGPVPCGECSPLLEYALRRIEACRFGPSKPVCSRCRAHCYGAEQRGRIRRVMRYAGPRMMLRHPLLAVLHLLDAGRGARP